MIDSRARAFDSYLRWGVRPGVELKFNPWHDPEDGRFTFAGQGHYWGGGGFTGGGGGSFGGGGASATKPWPREPRKDKVGDRPKPKPPITKPGATRVSKGAQPVALARKPINLQGFKRRVANGYSFDLDDADRTRFVDATLYLKREKRDRRAQSSASRPDRLANDDGGHHIAARFNGPRDEFNHFAQNANFNRGAYRALEDKWAAAIKRGRSVRVTIKPRYIGRSRRPDGLLVIYFIDGIRILQDFPNRTGGR